MGALFNGLGLFLSIGVCNVANLCVVFLYMWVSGGTGTEIVSFNDIRLVISVGEQERRVYLSMIVVW